jgi:hypothetical protein
MAMDSASASRNHKINQLESNRLPRLHIFETAKRDKAARPVVMTRHSLMMESLHAYLLF